MTLAQWKEAVWKDGLDYDENRSVVWLVGCVLVFGFMVGISLAGSEIVPFYFGARLLIFPLCLVVSYVIGLIPAFIKVLWWKRKGHYSHLN